jgi:SAM-dependent methyltransferase
MRHFLKRFFSRPPREEEAVKTAPSDAGFGVPRDTALSGWFDETTGELFKGFPIYSDDVVLDVGCGDAPFTRFCAMRGAEVIFADIDAEKVDATHNALKKTPAKKIRPLVSDCNPLPLETGTTDKIVSLEVLEHVDDPQAFIGELVRVGKPGALYLITVPAPEIEKLQKKGLAPDSYFTKPNHVRIWEREDFSNLVTNAGLTIVKQHTFGFYWSLWWVLFWACRQDLSPPWHPLLQSWTTTWSILLETEDGPRIKASLDDFLPKTQLIIARKPEP